jgi:hypothetical protein
MKLSDEKETEKLVYQNLDKFIQRIRMVAHQILQGSMKSFDPDQDGYELLYDDALQLHKNVNMLFYVRRTILINKAKLFEQYSHLLDKSTSTQPRDGWTRKDDKALLKVLATYGFEQPDKFAELQLSSS